MSIRESQCTVSVVCARRRRASRMSNAAAVEAPDNKKSRPSQAVSAHRGRFVTDRSTPV